MGRPKPLHCIIIDSWHPDALMRELERGHLPALACLLRRGCLSLECASIFPTVTPACLTSLATGLGPDGHGISGMLWYHRLDDRYVHYWPYPQSLVWGTLPHVLEDFFLRLNGEHLAKDAQTIFELLEAADVASGCINFPISRGPYRHRAEIPPSLRRFSPLLEDVTLDGPRVMRHGDLLGGAKRGRLWGRYGFTDHQGALYTAELVRSGTAPDFMLTYFNENDLRCHRHGPDHIGFSLRKVDAELGLIMAAYGSWENAASAARWVLVGDHAQSRTHPFRPGHALNVFKQFPQHRVSPLATGGLLRGGYDFAVAPNDRMAYFYFPEGSRSARDDVLELLCRWEAVDQIFWREGDAFIAHRPAAAQTLRWAPGGPYCDPYGAAWEISGSLGAVDASLDGTTIVYGDYPNALARVSAALGTEGESRIAITAALGYEFTSGFPMGRGNHGSLHRQDSYVPLLTVGLEQPVWPVRITDVVPMILRAFGVPIPAQLAQESLGSST